MHKNSHASKPLVIYHWLAWNYLWSETSIDSSRRCHYALWPSSIQCLQPCTHHPLCNIQPSNDLSHNLIVWSFIALKATSDFRRVTSSEVCGVDMQNSDPVVHKSVGKFQSDFGKQAGWPLAAGSHVPRVKIVFRQFVWSSYIPSGFRHMPENMPAKCSARPMKQDFRIRPSKWICKLSLGEHSNGTKTDSNA